MQLGSLARLTWIGFALVGCGGEAGGGGDGDADADADSDADGDTDADSDGDGDADADADTGCAALFGQTAGYVECLEEADQCAFFAAIDGTCDQACQSAGAQCLAAFDNSADDPCAQVDTDDCDAAESDQLCLCSRPAG